MHDTEARKILDSIMAETEGITREERLASEILRLGEELSQARRKLQVVLEQKSELEGLLRVNPDTSLPVYRYFYQELERLVDEGTSFWLVQIRLDNRYQKIKASRDRSKVLLYITTLRIQKVLGEVLYQSDRLDEFFVLHPTPEGREAILRTMVSVEKMIRLPHEGPAGDVSFGSYMGLVHFPGPSGKPSEIVHSAEIALQAAMASKHRIVEYTAQMGQHYDKQLQVEQDMHRATQTGFDGFYMVYQPFVDATHTIRGCESLIRWDHPVYGPIPPPHFIPVAERNGDIRMLGRWILYQSVLAARHWVAEGYTDVFVSVNLSPVQFNQRDMVERIEEVLQSQGLSADHLKLEVTEGALMTDPSDAIRKLNALRKLGARISIDDFGTGYSSLNYLRKLPIDTLKIDKSFVDDITTNTQNREIVRAILGMADSLGIETLAEGVETAEQRDLLFSEGCKYIQGYFYSRPVKDKDFLAYLHQGGRLPQA